jgi:hypothetical protein
MTEGITSYKLFIMAYDIIILEKIYIYQSYKNMSFSDT